MSSIHVFSIGSKRAVPQRRRKKTQPDMIFTEIGSGRGRLSCAQFVSLWLYYTWYSYYCYNFHLIFHTQMVSDHAGNFRKWTAIAYIYFPSPDLLSILTTVGTDDPSHCPSNVVGNNTVARAHAPPLIGIRSVLAFGRLCRPKTPGTSTA